MSKINQPFFKNDNGLGALVARHDAWLEQPLTRTSSVQFGDTHVQDLIVEGVATFKSPAVYVGSSHVVITDNIIDLNSEQATVGQGGIRINRGPNLPAYNFVYDESHKAMVMGYDNNIDSVLAVRADAIDDGAILLWDAQRSRMVGSRTIDRSVAFNEIMTTQLSFSENGTLTWESDYFVLTAPSTRLKTNTICEGSVTIGHTVFTFDDHDLSITNPLGRIAVTTPLEVSELLGRNLHATFDDTIVLDAPVVNITATSHWKHGALTGTTENNQYIFRTDNTLQIEASHLELPYYSIDTLTTVGTGATFEWVESARDFVLSPKSHVLLAPGRSLLFGTTSAGIHAEGTSLHVKGSRIELEASEFALGGQLLVTTSPSKVAFAANGGSFDLTSFNQVESNRLVMQHGSIEGDALTVSTTTSPIFVQPVISTGFLFDNNADWTGMRRVNNKLILRGHDLTLDALGILTLPAAVRIGNTQFVHLSVVESGVDAGTLLLSGSKVECRVPLKLTEAFANSFSTLSLTTRLLQWAPNISSMANSDILYTLAPMFKWGTAMGSTSMTLDSSGTLTVAALELPLLSATNSTLTIKGPITIPAIYFSVSDATGTSIAHFEDNVLAVQGIEVQGVFQSHGLTGNRLLSNLNAGGHHVTNLALPEDASDAVTKAYVDLLSTTAFTLLENARVATDINVDLATVVTSVDGVTLTTGDRIVLKGQTNAVQNGLYVLSGSGLVRPGDFNSATSVGSSSKTFLVAVKQGSKKGTTFGLVCSGQIDTNAVNVYVFTYGQIVGTSAADADSLVLGTGIERSTLGALQTSRDQRHVTQWGNIQTGTWQATPISVQYGGTGQTTFVPGRFICSGMNGLTESNLMLANGGIKFAENCQVTSQDGTSLSLSAHSTVDFATRGVQRVVIDATGRTVFGVGDHLGLVSVHGVLWTETLTSNRIDLGQGQQLFADANSVTFTDGIKSNALLLGRYKQIIDNGKLMLTCDQDPLNYTWQGSNQDLEWQLNSNEFRLKAAVPWVVEPFTRFADGLELFDPVTSSGICIEMSGQTLTLKGKGAQGQNSQRVDWGTGGQVDLIVSLSNKENTEHVTFDPTTHQYRVNVTDTYIDSTLHLYNTVRWVGSNLCSRILSAVGWYFATTLQTGTYVFVVASTTVTIDFDGTHQPVITLTEPLESPIYLYQSIHGGYHLFVDVQNGNPVALDVVKSPSFWNLIFEGTGLLPNGSDSGFDNDWTLIAEVAHMPPNHIWRGAGIVVPTVNTTQITASTASIDTCTVSSLQADSIETPIIRSGKIDHDGIFAINAPKIALNAVTVSQGIECNTLSADSVTTTALVGPMQTKWLERTNLGVDVFGLPINHIAPPIAPDDAATKSYVDNVTAGLRNIQSVRYLVSQNLSLADTQFVADSAYLAPNDLVLLKNQANASQNGVYRYDNTHHLVRAAKWQPGTIVDSAYIFVQEGKQYGATSWVLVNQVVVDTDMATFVQFSASMQYKAGNGISLDGNTFQIRTDDLFFSLDTGVLTLAPRAIGDGLTLSSTGSGPLSVSSITHLDTVGKITAGEWASTTAPIATSYGGTGVTAFHQDKAFVYHHDGTLIASSLLTIDPVQQKLGIGADNISSSLTLGSTTTTEWQTGAFLAFTSASRQFGIHSDSSGLYLETGASSDRTTWQPALTVDATSRVTVAKCLAAPMIDVASWRLSSQQDEFWAENLQENGTAFHIHAKNAPMMTLDIATNTNMNALQLTTDDTSAHIDSTQLPLSFSAAGHTEQLVLDTGGDVSMKGTLILPLTSGTGLHVVADTVVEGQLDVPTINTEKIDFDHATISSTARGATINGVVVGKNVPILSTLNVDELTLGTSTDSQLMVLSSSAITTFTALKVMNEPLYVEKGLTVGDTVTAPNVTVQDTLTFSDLEHSTTVSATLLDTTLAFYHPSQQPWSFVLYDPRTNRALGKEAGLAFSNFNGTKTTIATFANAPLPPAALELACGQASILLDGTSLHLSDSLVSKLTVQDDLQVNGAVIWSNNTYMAYDSALRLVVQDTQLVISANDIMTNVSTMIWAANSDAFAVCNATGVPVFSVDTITRAVNVRNSRLINVAPPQTSNDAVTKAYVDMMVKGLNQKQAVRAAASTQINLQLQWPTIDTIVLQEGESALLMSQSNAVENGIYLLAANGYLARRPDLALGDHAASTYCFVAEGFRNGDKGFVCTSDAPNDIVGTNDLLYTQFNGNLISAGLGLLKDSDNAMSIALGTESGLQIDSSNALRLSPLLAGTNLIYSRGVISLDSHLSITSIDQGSWNGSTIAVSKGGTGATTFLSNTIVAYDGTSLVSVSSVQPTPTGLTINGTLKTRQLDFGSNWSLQTQRLDSITPLRPPTITSQTKLLFSDNGRNAILWGDTSVPYWTTHDYGRHWQMQYWPFVASSASVQVALNTFGGIAAVQNGPVYVLDSTFGATEPPSISQTISPTAAWAFVVTSADGCVLCAASFTGTIVFSRDSGSTWRTLMLSNSTVTFLCLDEQSKSIFVGTSATVFVLPAMATTLSPINGLPTDAQWSTMAISKTSNLYLLVGHSSVVWQSTDAGSTWTALITDTLRNWISIAIGPEGDEWALLTLEGTIWYTLTNGQTTMTISTPGTSGGSAYTKLYYDGAYMVLCGSATSPRVWDKASDFATLRTLDAAITIAPQHHANTYMAIGNDHLLRSVALAGRTVLDVGSHITLYSDKDDVVPLLHLDGSLHVTEALDLDTPLPTFSGGTGTGSLPYGLAVAHAEGFQSLVPGYKSVPICVDGLHWTTQSGPTFLQTFDLVVGTSLQAWSPVLDNLATLTATTGSFIVGSGTSWGTQTLSDVKSTLGLGTLAYLSTINDTNWQGTPLQVNHGGTGSQSFAVNDFVYAATDGTLQSTTNIASIRANALWLGPQSGTSITNSNVVMQTRGKIAFLNDTAGLVWYDSSAPIWSMTSDGADLVLKSNVTNDVPLRITSLKTIIPQLESDHINTPYLEGEKVYTKQLVFSVADAPLLTWTDSNNVPLWQWQANATKLNLVASHTVMEVSTAGQITFFQDDALLVQGALKVNKPSGNQLLLQNGSAQTIFNQSTDTFYLFTSQQPIILNNGDATIQLVDDTIVLNADVTVNGKLALPDCLENRLDLIQIDQSTLSNITSISLKNAVASTITGYCMLVLAFEINVTSASTETSFELTLSQRATAFTYWYDILSTFNGNAGRATLYNGYVRTKDGANDARVSVAFQSTSTIANLPVHEVSLSLYFAL